MFGRKNKNEMQEWKMDAPAQTAQNMNHVPQYQPPMYQQPQYQQPAPIQPVQQPQPIPEPIIQKQEAVVPEPTKEKIQPQINNPVIDTFTILVRYHQEVVAAVSKYDRIIAELISLSKESTNETENEQEN